MVEREVRFLRRTRKVLNHNTLQRGWNMAYMKREVLSAIYNVIHRNADSVFADLDPSDYDGFEMHPIGTQSISVRIASKSGPPRWFHIKVSEPL
jgi:hypothetical protein